MGGVVAGGAVEAAGDTVGALVATTHNFDNAVEFSLPAKTGSDIVSTDSCQELPPKKIKYIYIYIYFFKKIKTWEK